MTDLEPLPTEFLSALGPLETAHCQSHDPLLQSGFAGGAQRWREEREPILEAVESGGDFLDIGCANGYLLECLVDWASVRGHRLVPHGLDCGPRLIQLAQQRFPDLSGHFHVANAWNWQPPRRYHFVYTLCDCVPESHLAACCRQLLQRVVVPGGRLIVGMYGSRSRGIPPQNLGALFQTLGFDIQGTVQGGDPPVTAFAWMDA